MAKSRLIVEDESKIKDVQELNESNTISIKPLAKIPNNYIPITLPTNGKLSAPKVLHFRDYTMADALELNTLDEDDRFLALVHVLSSMCYEDFDCSDLHINELMIILFSIHATFISNRIEKEYYIDDELPQGSDVGQLNHPDNISSTELLISKLVTKSIDEDLSGNELKDKFKEPFTLTDAITKSKFKFRLSRVKDLLVAQKACEEMFGKDISKFKYIKKQLEDIRQIKDPSERKSTMNSLIDNDDNYDAYYKFTQKYNENYVMLVQCQQLVSIDDEILESLDDKLLAYKTKVPKDIWEKYNDVVENYKFGLLEEQEFYSDVLQQSITRRFLFQLSNFLPSVNTSDSGRFSVSFD